MLFFICTSFAALNQVQKNLTDCYDTNSEIIYNKNIKRITVMLNPTGKKECQIFPRGIEASLVLYDGAVKNVLQAVVNDFNYSVTREIAFDLVSTEDVTVIIPGVSWQYNGQFYLSLDDIPNCVDLPNYNQERLALLVIYTYAELTQFEIAAFNEQKSALTECFFDNSTLVVDQTVNYLNVTLYPTRLCSLQLVDGYAGTTAQVKDVVLDIGTSQKNILIDISSYLRNDYALGTKMEIKINIFDLEWLKSILLDVMPTSQITFVSGNSQDNVTVKIVHTIKKTTKVTKYASVADTKLLLIGESFIAFQDFISIKHQAMFGQAIQNDYQHDTFRFRVSATFKDGTVMTIQKAYPFTFPVTMNMFTIECQGETRDYCIQFYTKLRADQFSASIIVDFTGYLSGKFVSYFSSTPEFLSSIMPINHIRDLNDHVYELDMSQMEPDYMQVIMNPQFYYQFNPTFKSVFDAYYVEENTSHLPFKLFFTTDKQPDGTLNCKASENESLCIQFVEQLQVGNGYLMMKMKAPANSKDLYIVIGHIYKTSSKQTDIVSITIGGLSLAGVLAIAIYYLSRQLQRMKQLKTRKIKFEAY